MKFYHSDEPVENWSQPSGVKQVNISKLSGLLAPEGFPENLIVGSLFKNIPKNYDSFGTVSVDTLCNGIVTDTTPPAAIKQVNLISLHSLMPQNSAWEAPVQAWVKDGGYESEVGGTFSNFITYVNPNPCERPPKSDSSISIKSSITSGENFVI